MKFPKVITVACEKGGVGKTTIATNLAVYLKALREDMPVTIFSFDNHFTVDKMFSLNKQSCDKTVRDIFYGRGIADLLKTGQYGVNYIPSCRELSSIGERYDIFTSRLAESSIDGVVIIDTRPTMDFFTKSALLASDIVIIPVKDLPSIDNLRGIVDFCEEADGLSPVLKLLPSIVDGMVRFRDNTITVDELLRLVAMERGYELMDASIPKSPKVASLTTNMKLHTYPVITHARGTLAHKRFTAATKEVLSILDGINEPRSLGILRKDIFASADDDDHTYSRIMAELSPDCLLCGKNNRTGNGNIKPETLYLESGESLRGFIDNSCFVIHILDELVKVEEDLLHFREGLIEEMSGDSALRIEFEGLNSGGPLNHISFSLYDGKGEMVFEGMVNSPPSSPLTSNLSRITEKKSNGIAPCVIKFGGRPFPDAILLDGRYRDFQSLKVRILPDFNHDARPKKMRFFRANIF